MYAKKIIERNIFHKNKPMCISFPSYVFLPFKLRHLALSVKIAFNTGASHQNQNQIIDPWWETGSAAVASIVEQLNEKGNKTHLR